MSVICNASLRTCTDRFWLCLMITDTKNFLASPLPLPRNKIKLNSYLWTTFRVATLSLMWVVIVLDKWRNCNQHCLILTFHTGRTCHRPPSLSLGCMILVFACRKHCRGPFPEAKLKWHTHVWRQFATGNSSSDCMCSLCTLPTSHAWPHGLESSLAQGGVVW